MSVSDTPEDSLVSVQASNSAPVGEVANEDRSDDLTRLLNRIRAEAIFAVKWWIDVDPGRAAPLEPIVSILSVNNLVVSEGLGDAGFKSDPENFEVQFNAKVLRNINLAVEKLFSQHESGETLEELKRQAIALYVFHELTHITQRFVEHNLAKTLKSAFTPDELSKIDLVADVRAAHCNALIFTAKTESQSKEVYLKSYRNNLLLSYQLLVGAFSIKDADHKKKRALGLLTNVALCHSALQSTGEDADRRLALAVRPAFTSVDQDGGGVVALTCAEQGWEILFHGSVATNRMTVAEMWDQIGTSDPTDILALLRVAYERLM